MALLPGTRSSAIAAIILGSMSLSLAFGSDDLDDGDQTRPSAGMLRYPDVSKDSIVFSYSGDLWTVSRDGGTARPLASPPGDELFPRFSEDGQNIAFVGNYEGNQDIYTIATHGGTARRETYHPSGEILCDWTPDGRLLFSTNGYAGLARQPQLFTISGDAPLAEQMPVPYGTNGAVSADGKWLAYTPHSRDNRTWKRYRGGMASDVWLFNLETKESKQITDWEGTDSLPMWHGQVIYYLSDAGPESRLNIWSYDQSSGDRQQVTTFKDFDCKWPSMGPGSSGQGEIVLQNGSHLWLVDLSNGATSTVDIVIPGDRPTLRPQRVDASEFVASGDISPQGKRVIVEARGDIWSLPAKNGSPRNMTRSSGVAERMPSWSPDGQWIAYFADNTGEYQLYVMQSDGKGESRQLTTEGKTYRYNPSWSPDSKRIVYTDKAGNIFLHTVESGETVKVDTDPTAQQPAVSWSHDSAWLAYAKAAKEHGAAQSIWVYNLSSGEARPVTDGFFNCSNPAFDRKGDYIYCTSHRAFNQPRYEDVGTSFVYSGTEVVLAIPLRADVELPWLPKTDEETFGEEKDTEEKKDETEKSETDSSEESSGPSGTWSGEILTEELPAEARSFTLTLNVAADNSVSGRINAAQGTLDITSGSYDPDSGKLTLTAQNDEVSVTISATITGDSLSGSVDVNGGEMVVNIEATRDSAGGSDDDQDATDAKKSDKPVTIDFEGIVGRTFQLPASQGNFGSLAVNDKNQLIYARVSGRGPGGKSSINLFDLSDDAKVEKTVVDGAAQFTMSASGKKLLVRRGEDGFIVNAAAGQSLSGKIKTEGMHVMIDPREEWKQIFTDAWRIERDFFYDPTMHGVDWKAVYDRYSAMIDDCNSRADVAFVIGEMISEINVGHAYYRAGPGSGPDDRQSIGLLGCRFEAAGGRYRIAEIFEGAPWDTDARNPLRSVGIQENDFILAVNGVELNSDVNPYSVFQGMAGMTVVLTVSKDAELDDQDKEIPFNVLSDDGNLRFRAWIERQRKRVDERTSGRVGYIYVINTGVPGQNDLFRQFYGQMGKEALIIDDRWNGGGQIPTRFIELLNRPVTNYWAKRDGLDWTWPPDSHQGPKCMLINGMAGSGGDMFPALFKQAGLGKLVGMRTWGGLVGISGNPQMVDGSSVTAPTFAFYEKDGTWGIEGHGVDPDILVIDDPAQMQNGGDPQLDAAIDLMLSELDSNAYRKPPRPAYPDRSKMGIGDSDK